MLLVKAPAVAVAAALGIVGRTGVDTLRAEENFSSEFFLRKEWVEGLLGESTLSPRP